MAAKKHRELVRDTLRAEKARVGVTFDDLSARLAQSGIQQTPTNLSSKFGRGLMEAGLFLAILDALGVEKLSIPDLIKDLRPRPGSSDTA